MNPIEAEAFVRKIVNAFESSSAPETILDFFADDAIGHVKNETFNKDDAYNRITYMQKRYPQRKFFYEDVVSFDNTLIYKCTQTFFDEALKKPSRSVLTVIYQLNDTQDQIKQWWLISDYDMNYRIKEGDHPKEEDMTLDITSKREFFNFIQTYRYYYNNQPIELTDRETESLYYFLNGYSAKEAAQIMHVSNRTFEGYIANVKDKYHCSTKTELRNALFPHGKSTESKEC